MDDCSTFASPDAYRFAIIPQVSKLAASAGELSAACNLSDDIDFSFFGNALEEQEPCDIIKHAALADEPVVTEASVFFAAYAKKASQRQSDGDDKGKMQLWRKPVYP